MFCTSKERETCDVEKRGCEGCFYKGISEEELLKKFNQEKKMPLTQLIRTFMRQGIQNFATVKIKDLKQLIFMYNQEKESHKIDNENYKILHDDVTALAKYMGLEENAIIDEMYEAFDKEKEKNKNLIEGIKEIRDKLEVKDYYFTNDAIDDLTKLLGEEVEDKL